MMNKIMVEVELVPVTCCKCGVIFGLNYEQDRNLREDGHSFYCPNGHGQHFTEPTDEKLKKLKRELEYAKKDITWWKEEAERKAANLSATKGHLTRIKNRVANGVCPCCHHQFENLHHHMETKHPDYVEK